MDELAVREQEAVELVQKLEQGDITMGNAEEERRAYPIEKIDRVNSLIGELQERIAFLERGLSVILNPDEVRATEEKNTPDVAGSTRSAVMEALEAPEREVQECIHHLNNIIGRLDL